MFNGSAKACEVKGTPMPATGQGSGISAILQVCQEWPRGVDDCGLMMRFDFLDVLEDYSREIVAPSLTNTAGFRYQLSVLFEKKVTSPLLDFPPF